MPLHKSSSEDGSGGTLRCIFLFVLCCRIIFPMVVIVYQVNVSPYLTEPALPFRQMGQQEEEQVLLAELPQVAAQTGHASDIQRFVQLRLVDLWH